MLVSLDKNKWLYDWLQEKYQKEWYDLLMAESIQVPRPKELRTKLVELLNNKGYKAKLTSKNDIILSLKEEDYMWLKLRYD